MTRRHLHRTEREAITQIMIGLGVLASLHNPHRIVSDDPKGLESGANAHRQFSPGVLWIFTGERRADAARGSQDAYRARKHRRSNPVVFLRTYAHVLTDEPAARLAELRADVAALYGLDGTQGVHGDDRVMPDHLTGTSWAGDSPATQGFS